MSLEVKAFGVEYFDENILTKLRSIFSRTLCRENAYLTIIFKIFWHLKYDYHCKIFKKKLLWFWRIKIYFKCSFPSVYRICIYILIFYDYKETNVIENLHFNYTIYGNPYKHNNDKCKSIFLFYSENCHICIN